MWHTVKAIMGLSDPALEDVAKGVVNFCFGVVACSLLAVSIFVYDSWSMSVGSFCFVQFLSVVFSMKAGSK